METVPSRTVAKLLAARAAQVRQLEWGLPSPCVSVCSMAGEFCGGCLRTLDEIAAWGAASDADKRVIWARIEQRLQSAP